MRIFSYFLSFFGFVFPLISSATSQDVWSLREIKTKIIKMNEKFEFLSDEIDEVKVNNNKLGFNQDRLTNQLSIELMRSKQREKDLLSEINEMKKGWKDLSVKLGQEGSDREIHEIKCKKREEDSRNDIQTFKQQLGEMDRMLKLEPWKNEANAMNKELKILRVRLEQEVSDGKAHGKQCKQRGEAIERAVDGTNEEISELKTTVGSLQKSVFLTKPHAFSRFTDEFYKKGEPDFTWTVDDIRNKVKRTNFTLLSEVFPVKGYSFGARANLSLDNNNYLQISFAYKDLSESGKDLNLKLIPSVYYVYKDRPTNIILKKFNYLFASVMQYDVFYYTRALIASNDIASDNISIGIYVEPPEGTLPCYSRDGTLAWAIGHFRSKREMERKYWVSARPSPCFYTSPKGYRVRAYVFLNGFNEYTGNGLTVEIAFLTGPHDADLSRSFKHRTTVTFYHPTDPTKHIVKSVEGDLSNMRTYMIDMGTHAEVENLLIQDTLYYHVMVIPARNQ